MICFDRLLLFLLVALFGSSIGFAQQVLVVDINQGPGADYQFVNQAVMAAHEGDLILIRRGEYPNPVLIDGKSLVLHAEAFGGVTLEGMIRITNLGPTQQVSLARLSCSVATGDGIQVNGNRGRVWLQDIRMLAGGDLRIEDSDAVTLIESNFFEGGFDSGAAITLVNSDVEMYYCKVRPAARRGLGVTGVELIDASLTLQAGFVTGGLGRSTSTSAGTGGSAILLSGTTGLSQTRNNQSLLTGGPAGPDPMNGGAGATGQVIELQGAGGTFCLLPGGAHKLTRNSPLNSGASAQLSFQGHVGDRVFLLISRHSDFAREIMPAIGPLVLSPGSFLISIGTISGTGGGAGSLQLPIMAPDIMLGSETLYIQGIFFGTPGNRHVSFGQPGIVTVLGANF